ncbi:hypothetical protein B296_00028682 [Ensete ventricosum]|uniref:Uncharacterized protein n=1 Tax=Ensete ventricosum TaxID=4639 RepID=A0A426XW31_ENSVE|nr:hypothetical protein B296_00028682 [Ensete ventricosum]
MHSRRVPNRIVLTSVRSVAAATSAVKRHPPSAIGHLVRTSLPFALPLLRHHHGQNAACALLSIRTCSSSPPSRSQPLPLPRSYDPLPLLDSTLPHLSVAPTALLIGVYSSTSTSLPQSTPSSAPILCTSPPATEAEQTQLFSHHFFAVK